MKMNYKPPMLIILCLLLSSCVALVAAGAAGGLIVYDKRSVSMIERDARIFYVLRKAIVANPEFAESHIVISSFNQIVLLAGQTPSASLRVQAEKIAKNTPEVLRVYNEMTIDDPISLTERSKDSWITGQVKAKMITKKGLESGSIRVVTENGVVYLMGIATREQADLAVNVARHVPHVRKVVKVFRYIV